jgi:hypothetical protein
MEHVNDDMDELFRRAADNYPLNTDSADWNAVVKKLAADESVADNASSKNKNKSYKHLLWLLLLLPLGWMYKNYVSKNNNTSNAISKNILNKKFPDASFSTKDIDPQSRVTKSLTVVPNNSFALINASGIHTNIKYKRNSKLYSAIDYTVSNTSLVSDKPSSLVIPPLNGVDSKQESGSANQLNNKIDNVKSENETATKKLNDHESYGDKKVEEEVVDILKIDENNIVNKSNKKIRITKEGGLYAGIIISPDISTVKLQTVKKIGVGVGLLVGFRLNKKFSVESGMFWDKKYYYSDGKYFSTKRVYTNPAAQIKNVDGVCNMIEIPIIIKYNLTTGKTYFSASAGFSSYIMKNEKYDYVIIYNNGQPYKRSSTYNNSSTNFLATANFGVGYNRALKQNITLRIESYLKIPVKGIGIGSLPIMSTGLNIGIIKKFPSKF